MTTPRRHRATAGAALAVLVASRVARAQEASVELARLELLREAEGASRRGEHARAIELARRAATIRATPSVAHFLSRSHLALAQHLDALAQAVACTRGAEADLGLHNRDALLVACSALAARASAQVGRVVVRVAPPIPEGLTVRIGAAALPASMLGIAWAVEPGEVQVEASAQGFAPARRAVSVGAGQVETLDLDLAPIAPLAPVAAPAAPSTVGPAIDARPRDRRGARSRWIGVGITLSSLAAANLLASGIAYTLAAHARDDRDAACPSPCARDDAGYPSAAQDDARYRERLAFTSGALLVGATLSAGAVVWWWRARPEAPRLAPSVSASRGILLAGLWARW